MTSCAGTAAAGTSHCSAGSTSCLCCPWQAVDFAAQDWRLAPCLPLLVLSLVIERLPLDRPSESRHQLPCGSADRCAHGMSCQQILMGLDAASIMLATDTW